MLTRQRFRLDPNDFVIVLMGPTGSGRTNFINTLTGNAERRKAATLRSDTQDITPYPISYQGSRLVLVDTPGFDNTHREDSEILRVIADWLIRKHPDGTTLKVAGIIYFHRITDSRISSPVYKNLQMFGRLCGNIPLPRTRLVTTMWDRVKDQGAAMQREAQLKGDFWRVLIEGGASVHRFHNTPHSARDVVESLLSMGQDSDELLLQEELVEQQKRLTETEAGKVVYNRYQKLLADQKRVLMELATDAKRENNPDLAKNLQEEYVKTDAQLQKTFEGKVSVPKRVLLWMFGRKSSMPVKSIELG